VLAIWDTGDLFALGRTVCPKNGDVWHCVSITDWLEGAKGCNGRPQTKTRRERLVPGSSLENRQDGLMTKIHGCLECMHDRTTADRINSETTQAAVDAARVLDLATIFGAVPPSPRDAMHLGQVGTADTIFEACGTGVEFRLYAADLRGGLNNLVHGDTFHVGSEAYEISFSLGSREIITCSRAADALRGPLFSWWKARGVKYTHPAAFKARRTALKVAAAYVDRHPHVWIDRDVCELYNEWVLNEGPMPDSVIEAATGKALGSGLHV
jgi:hypothetical protein